MKIAYSPCPNDTFVFHALVHGLIPGAPEFDVTYADIDITNRWAAGEGYSGDLDNSPDNPVRLSGSSNTDSLGGLGNPVRPDVLKISFAALPWVLSEYALLPCGGALGRGCGPLILTKNKSAILTGRKIAVPSERSTAYLLFRLWAAQNVPGGVGEIVIMPFHQIMPAIRDGLVDAGLVIHEARFTYPSYGLHLLTDLGNWWEADSGLPIPLGAIIAHRSLDLAAITGWIRASVEYAWAHPEVSREYVLHHAQEMNPDVAQAHIDLYVNQFTANLGENGYKAVTALLSRASREGLVPGMNPTTLSIMKSLF
ncbi:MAG TPA: 1,4-dihydroxy-6-naphthoate synthase [Bacilli bacterium]